MATTHGEVDNPRNKADAIEEHLIPDDHTQLSTPTQTSELKLELGMTFITRDQKVVTIVKECRVLNNDKSISEYWEGDNHTKYQTNGRVNVDESGPNDIVMAIGSGVSQIDISAGLEHVRKAEEILHPAGLEVIVRPERKTESETQTTPANSDNKQE